MATRTEARDAIDSLTRGLAHLVESADYHADDLPAGKAGRALAKDLADLRGRAYGCLLQLQGLDEDAVRAALVEGDYSFLRLCPAGA
jgi:hypothetical protein